MAGEDNFILISCKENAHTYTHVEPNKRWNTKGGKSNRACRATHINLEQKASELSRWRKEGFP